MKKIFLIFLILSCLLVALASLFFYSSLVVHETHSQCETDFIIEKTYFDVVQSLAAKEPLEKIVESSDGKLKNKQWQKFIITRPKRLLNLKEYELEGILDFNVEKKDRSLGNLILRFQQKVNVKKDQFNIQTYLREPEVDVIYYNKIIRIIPINEFKTKINLKSELKVKKIIPYFFKDFMEDKVEEINKNDLINLKNNLIMAVEQPGLNIELKKKKSKNRIYKLTI